VSWTRRHPGALSALAALVMVALAFGVFYLIEENAFLRAQQANPSLARVRGPRHESLHIWGAISLIVGFWGVGLFCIVQRRARGSIDRFGRQVWPGPLQPLGRRTLSIAIGGGLILVACGVMGLANAIEAHVWEGESILGQIALLYLPIYFGLAILAMVIRDYRLVHYGFPAKSEIGSAGRQLTAAQIISIRRALEEFDLQGAIERCRQAVPDASLKEARRFVFALRRGFRAQHPDKFLPPPLSLATLNRKVMGICALIETVLLGVLWLAMPQSDPASAVSQFTYSLLFGMGLMAFTRVKGFWKRMLLLAPAVTVMILSEAIVSRLTEASSHSLGPYLCGFVCGVFLMVSGFTPRRRKV